MTVGKVVKGVKNTPIKTEIKENNINKNVQKAVPCSKLLKIISVGIAIIHWIIKRIIVKNKAGKNKRQNVAHQRCLTKLQLVLKD